MKKTSWLLLISIFAICLLAAYGGTLGQSGSKTMIRFLALGGFFLLCISLMLGPLAVLLPRIFADLLESRRAIGISAAIFIALHFMLAMMLYFGWNFDNVLGNFSLLIVVPAMIFLIPLTFTSSDWAIKKMGMKNWKLLQYLAYPLFILAFAHFLLEASGPAFLPPPFPAYNIAEAKMVGLGIITIILQIAGFATRRKRASKK